MWGLNLQTPPPPVEEGGGERALFLSTPSFLPPKPSNSSLVGAPARTSRTGVAPGQATQRRSRAVSDPTAGN